jgi:hypothetical protein
MQTTTQIEAFQILTGKFTEDEAKKLVAAFGNPESDNILTQKDKVDLITRMDSHFKWLLGILGTMIIAGFTVIMFFLNNILNSIHPPA